MLDFHISSAQIAFFGFRFKFRQITVDITFFLVLPRHSLLCDRRLCFFFDLSRLVSVFVSSTSSQHGTSTWFKMISKLFVNHFHFSKLILHNHLVEIMCARYCCYLWRFCFRRDRLSEKYENPMLALNCGSLLGGRKWMKCSWPMADLESCKK